MTKTTIFLLLATLLLTACSSPVTTTPAVAVPTETVQATVFPTSENILSDWQLYQNPEFGLSFTFPVDWFGPEEYLSEQTLRVEIGSDRVYPYGSDPETRIYNGSNSYSIIIQYTKNNQNDYWVETYQQLQTMADGESFSDSRGMIIKVRELQPGGFEGVEFISTLSETAQTEPVYIRQVYLVDEQSNFLSIMGTPTNVVLEDGTDWREIYQQIDQTNVEIFQQIIDTCVVIE